MRNEQGGGAKALLQRADLVAQMAAYASVQRRQRLIEQQRARVDGQRTGQCHALLLAARQLAHRPVLKTLQAHQLQQLHCLLAPCSQVHAAQLETVRHIAEHMQVREQRVVLEHHAHAAQVHWLGRQIFTLQQDSAAVAALQPRHQFEQG